MDDNEFRKRLSEVAEWKIPETEQETSKNAKKKRGRKSAEEQYQEQHEEVFLEMFDGVNPTKAPLLLKVKHTPVTCECGRVCTEGCQKEAKLYETKTGIHWKIKCKTCGMTQNPITGVFDLNSQKASIVWHSFLRDTKGAYKSKGNIAKENTIIRSYPETNEPL